MAIELVKRLSAAASVPVYAAIGSDRLGAVEQLSLSEGLSFEQSVRSARLLLVTGHVRPEDRTDLHRLHDQLAHPRATVWWHATPDPAFPDALTIGNGDDPAATLAAVYRQLLSGERASEDDLLPDQPPNPWEGRGDHGQGGEGMMGGTPYGRPMAMTGNDLRDGLALDVYTAEFGPFLSIFPPGLKLRIALQGDVIQTAEVVRPPSPQRFDDAGTMLRSLIARQLCVLGLPALATRVLASNGMARTAERLRRLVTCTGAFHAIPPGLGATGSSDARGRFAAWWEDLAKGETNTPRRGPPAKPLVELLARLEWHEAIIVINSFAIPVLIEMCPVEAADGAQQRRG